jgi:hypothetical protein
VKISFTVNGSVSIKLTPESKLEDSMLEEMRARAEKGIIFTIGSETFPTPSGSPSWAGVHYIFREP